MRVVADFLSSHRTLLNVIMGVTVVVALAKVLDQFSFRSLRHVMAQARLGWLVAAFCSAISVTLCKSQFLRLLLSSHAGLTKRETLRCAATCSVVSTLFPLRAGDIYRPLFLRRRHSVPVVQSLAILLVEKVADAVALLFISTPALILVGQSRSWLHQSSAILLMVASLVAVGGLSLVMLARLRTVQREVRLQYKAVALGALAVAAGWLADWLHLQFVLIALNVRVSKLAASLILFAINVAITVPVAPANCGTLELATIAALKLLAIAPTTALGVALAYHAIQLIALAAVFAWVTPRQKWSSVFVEARSAPAASGRCEIRNTEHRPDEAVRS